MRMHGTDRAGKDSGLLLALAFSAATALYLRFFNSLAVPNPDFFEYRWNALMYLQRSLPTSFKRLPLFPVLMALLSLVMPGPEPELLAAHCLNLLLAPLCLWLIYRIAREFVQPLTGLAIVALCAVNREMVYSVAEAMPEITILTGILLTVYLALRGSPWAYVAVFLASLTRFEAALLIPVLVLHDRLVTTGPRKIRSLLWGALASLGIVGWSALSFSAHTVPYMGEMLARPGHPMAFVTSALHAAGDFLPHALFRTDVARRATFLVELALLAGGAAALVKRHRVRMTVLLGLLCTYTVVHMTFPAHIDRYAVPVLWLLYLLMAAAVERLMARVRSSAAAPARWLAALGVCAMVGFGVASTVKCMTSGHIRIGRIQFRRVGEWYRDAATPGDKMVVQYLPIVHYYSRLSTEAFLPSKSLESSTPTALLEELRAKGVTYIVWDNQPDPTGYYTIEHKMWLLNWMKARRLPELEPVHTIHEGSNEAIIYRVRPHAHLHAAHP